MIVNSIGFVTGGYSLASASYGIGSTFTSVLGDLGAEVDGIRWYTPTTGLSLSNGDVLTVKTLGSEYSPDDNLATRLRVVTSSNGSPNVTFSGSGGYSNSNIRVSNPSSNVAPEPGSFALALTGGAALLGICIRRRRNAA